jgi:hypothetical protein
VIPNDAGSPAEAGRPVERDTPMTAIYVQVLLVEAAIIVALWWFGRIFS